MPMKNKKLIRVLLLITSLILAGFIIQYYWSTSALDDLKFVPLYLMLITLGYIVTQIIRRFLFKNQNWWDWLYYFSLSAMMLPIFFASTENLNIFNIITDYGTFFFIIPVAFDLKMMMTKSESINL